ncbi:MAG: R2-like ligand-binding oxidase [Anaerolineae bacterium]|nr:MAG: R2-like ligand-binding oxidase [Anaerolineae bacterium]
MSALHKSFASATRGLDRTHPAMRLFEKAKKYGIWNPSELDLEQDKTDWAALTPDEQDLNLRLLSMFAAGEEAVTLDLLPLIQVVAQEGRIEEEIFLTSFLWEEAKHTDFFNRVLSEVCAHPADLSHYHTPSYNAIFYEALPAALDALRADPSPLTQMRASVTYNMVVEGMLAETGYHAFFTMLQENDSMPGLREGIRLLKQDESRHIAYGIFLLSRLAAEHPHLWEDLEAHMNSLLYPAIAIISEAFAAYEVVPFGLVEDTFVSYAMDQFQKRFERLEKARGASLPEILDRANRIIDANDG